MGKKEGTRDDIPRIYKQRPPSILKGVKGEEGVEGVEGERMWRECLKGAKEEKMRLWLGREYGEVILLFAY